MYFLDKNRLYFFPKIADRHIKKVSLLL